MLLLRRKWPSSKLQPEFRFIRALRSPYHVSWDERGFYRISSKAFGPSSTDKKLSGDLEEVLAHDGLNPDCMYPAVRDPVGAASVTIGQMREAGALVEHDPTTFNWYHGAASGTGKDKVKRKLAKVAVEFIKIDQALAKRLHEEADAKQVSA
ncbi:hypothetical protein [Bradyrhizobium sp. BRP23]|uniref:hypothetical protein n=1 Tax=Bradyrhizobium sp. BRP23 TaxID=2793820 RepID=UPI001CD639E1|nr:hypothetical protein [Bradyrhizobium sp. BRP23]MCA1381266.1 hypothetical protein [Bradyrhizobium sp. BRP05]MCA1418614.1 hypothetical protein [Bradyrhizobium sp. BRP23]